MLITEDRRDTRLGGNLGLSYGIAWRRLVVSAGMSAQVYHVPGASYSSKTYGYGLSVGMRF